MIQLDVKGLTIAFGARTLLSDASFSLQDGERLGLVGANGAGKTTLLKTILGRRDTDGGAVSFAKGLKVGYLEQNSTLPDEGTVLTYAESACASLLNIERELEELAVRMETDHSLAERYSELSERFEAQDGYAVHSRITGVLRGIGLRDSFFTRELSSLSGGEKTRLALAHLLLSDCDMLFLDEPTNHLDLQAIEWLTDFLCAGKKTVLTVSHDRYLLDRLCGGIALLQNERLIYYKGNYTQFRQKLDEQNRLQLKLSEEQQKEIKRQEEIIARFRSYNREKSIRAARSREKALDRMEIIDAPEKLARPRLRFKEPSRTGTEVLTFSGEFFFGERKMLADDFLLLSGSRVAIIGANGTGKTTFLHLLRGELPFSGTVRWGAGVKIGYYDQQLAGLNPENTVLDEIWLGDRQLSLTEVRSFAAAMLFTGDDVFKTVGKLSGGEKARVALCKLALGGYNVLLLDEPTNHLDMDCREVLEDALSAFTGTIIAVSHDRYFINRIATEVWKLENAAFARTKGGYDDFLNAGKPTEEPKQVNKTAEAKARAQDRRARQETRDRKAALQKLESEIAHFEAETARIEELFSDASTYENHEQALALNREYEEKKQLLSSLYERWERLQDD